MGLEPLVHLLGDSIMSNLDFLEKETVGCGKNITENAPQFGVVLAKVSE